MHFTTLVSTVTALAGLAGGAPAPVAPRGYSVSADDGFPDPSPEQLAEISKQAGGTLSNAPPPKINASSVPIFQLVAFNENFEVAYFSSMIHNLTSGYYDKELEKNPKEKKVLLEILQTISAQEKLHSLNALRVLKNNNAFAPPPCTYRFPTTGLYDAIEFASTFTSFVMGTLQDASQGLAKNGDTGAVRSVASSLGQEGEQNGFYRTLLSRKPSQKPFLTTSIAPFAYSLLQRFVDKCPFPITDIKLPVFPPLDVVTGRGGFDVEAKDQDIVFQADLDAVKEQVGKCDGLFITYFTGQDVPSSWPVKKCKWDGTKVVVEAFFPYEKLIMDGMTIASLTKGNTFSAPGDVAAATLAAPGLIQVNARILK